MVSVCAKCFSSWRKVNYATIDQHIKENNGRSRIPIIYRVGRVNYYSSPTLRVDIKAVQLTEGA